MSPRIISPEPVITKMLRARKPILPRPFRENILNFIEGVERTLRSTEFWINFTAGQIAMRLVSELITMIREGLTVS